MKKLLKLITNKIFIVGLLIIAQFFLVMYFANSIIFSYNIVYVLMIVLSILLVVWVVNRDENPYYALAWSIVILTFPPIGAVIYLIMGDRKAPEELREKLQNLSKALSCLKIYQLWRKSNDLIHQFINR